MLIEKWRRRGKLLAENQACTGMKPALPIVADYGRSNRAPGGAGKYRGIVADPRHGCVSHLATHTCVGSCGTPFSVNSR